MVGAPSTNYTLDSQPIWVGFLAFAMRRPGEEMERWRGRRDGEMRGREEREEMEGGKKRDGGRRDGEEERWRRGEMEKREERGREEREE
jgi:hypothetical protein